MSDTQTLAVYASQADKYADLVESAGTDKHLLAFLDSLPKGAEILDWGCGVGNAGGYAKANGFEVTATDASAEFAAKAQELFDLKVRIETFADLADVDAYDGIWANFSLLHAPKAAMPKHLAQARRALRSGGRFCIAMKTGDGEHRDGIGRFYAYYGEDELKELLAQAGFTVTDQTNGVTVGLDGRDWPWVVLHCDG